MNKNIEQGRTVIVGMGATGLSCARFLAARGVAFSVMDSRAQPPLLEQFRAQFPGVALYCGDFDAAELAGAPEVILSPGVDPAHPQLRAAGTALLGDIELFYREAAAPIVAITGTNAKSTVTTLVWKMAQAAGLRVACGGNLGTPALELLADDVELYVLELSSFQLETVHEFRADIAAMLNFAPDHLDRYPDMGAYHRAKQRIFKRARRAVYNRDDAMTRPALALEPIGFGLSPPGPGDFGLRCTASGEMLVCGERELMAVAELPMQGRHNVANALAAMAIASAAQIGLEAQLEVLRSYRGLAHRCQPVRSIAGVDFIDDSKGTNVAAAVAALRGLAAGRAGRIVLIAGGIAKEEDFSALGEELGHSGRAAVLLGRDADRLGAAFDPALPQRRASDMCEAVQMAQALAQPGDIVLLSPACASFDMFRDYRHRGEEFTRLVLALPGASREPK